MCGHVESVAVRRVAQTRCCPSSEEDHTSSGCDGYTGIVKEVPDMSLEERVGVRLEFRAGGAESQRWEGIWCIWGLTKIIVLLESQGAAGDKARKRACLPRRLLLLTVPVNGT